MKRYRYTIAAALVFAGLLVWVLTNERGRVPEAGEVFGLDVHNVTRLEIIPRDTKAMTFVKRGDQWWITAPFVGWADKDQVTSIATSLCELKPDKRPNANPDNKDFGLQKPFVTAAVFIGKRKYQVSLGNQTPVGGENYALIPGKKGVFIVPSYLKTDLLKKPEDMRDRKLVHYKQDDVVSIDLTDASGTFHIDSKPAAGPTTTDRDWFLTTPIKARADRWTVFDTLASKPAETQAKSFEDMPKDLSSVGLAKPAVTLTLKTKDGKSFTIYLGSKTRKSVPRDNAPGTPGGPSGNETRNLVYASVQGRPDLMLVDQSFLTDMDKNLMQLRDKHVILLDRSTIRSIKVERAKGFSFSVAKRGNLWYVDTPQPAEAQQTKIEDILWNLEDLETSSFIENPTDLKQYGLAVPSAVISIGLANGKNIKLSLGFKTKDGKYYCKRSDADTVYTVSDTLLGGMPKSAADLKSGGTEAAPSTAPAGVIPGTMPGMKGGPPPPTSPSPSH